MKATWFAMSCLVLGVFACAWAQDAAPATAAGDLELFESGKEWEFKRNTGKGSFELTKDGDLPIGVLSYDFSGSKSKKPGSVIAGLKTELPEGATAFTVDARADRALRITIRLKDDTGQTFQKKGKIAGTGKWETVSMPLTRKIEHWGGANDGKIHYPVREVILSVVAPDEEPLSGKVEFARAAAVAGAAAPAAD